jgi:hypothetical protein
MQRLLRYITLASLAAAAWTSAASAQILVDPSLSANAKKNGHPAAQPNFTSRATAPWPRLDPGAIFCRTRDDLDAHHRAVQARLDGQPVSALGSPNCRVVGAPTAIDVVTRAAPSATEVRLKGDEDTGWTDTWLPSTAPVH